MRTGLCLSGLQGVKLRNLFYTYFFKRFPEVSRRWRSGTGGNKDSGEGVSFASNPALLLASCVTLIKKLLHLWASVSSHVKEE